MHRITATDLTPLQIATRRHREADMLVAGTYGRMNGQFHGCSVGCLAHDIKPSWDSDSIGDAGHALVAEHFGYPEWLVRLQDTVFEGLPKGEREDWHVQLADAIAARGRDWQIVMHAVHAAILRISYRTAGSASEAVQRVLDLHERAVRGEIVTSDEWSAAARAAESAAWAAEESAAWAAAWSAGGSAAWAAEESAAWAAAESAGGSAWSAAYRKIRDAVLAEVGRS